jgi:hypothetical protein
MLGEQLPDELIYSRVRTPNTATSPPAPTPAPKGRQVSIVDASIEYQRHRNSINSITYLIEHVSRPNLLTAESSLIQFLVLKSERCRVSERATDIRAG